MGAKCDESQKSKIDSGISNVIIYSTLSLQSKKYWKIRKLSCIIKKILDCEDMRCYSEEKYPVPVHIVSFPRSLEMSRFFAPKKVLYYPPLLPAGNSVTIPASESLPSPRLWISPSILRKISSYNENLAPSIDNVIKLSNCVILRPVFTLVVRISNLSKRWRLPHK